MSPYPTKALPSHLPGLIARMELRDSAQMKDGDWETLISEAVVATTGMDEVGPMAMMGITPGGWIWALSTPAATAHPFWIVRGAKRVVDEGLRLFPVLRGATDEDYPSTMRLMLWLGFRYGPPREAFGRTVRLMELRRASA